MEPYTPFVSEKLHAELSLLLFGIGFLLFSWLFVYQLTNPKSKRSLFVEVLVALIVSLVWGFAGTFGLLWAGLYI